MHSVKSKMYYTVIKWACRLKDNMGLMTSLLNILFSPIFRQLISASLQYASPDQRRDLNRMLSLQYVCDLWERLTINLLSGSCLYIHLNNILVSALVNQNQVSGHILLRSVAGNDPKSTT